MDIGSYTHQPTTVTLAQAARAFDMAMHEDGMVCITNHGVPLEIIAAAEEAAAAFFERDDKWDYGDPLVYGIEGYTQPGVEAVARSTGAESKADAVESYVHMTRPLQPAILANATQPYWDAMTSLLESLHRIKADVFNIDYETIASMYFEPGGTALRLAHYPESAMEQRYGAHTDYLTLTILRATQPGLQVQKRDGQFYDVHLDPRALVINAGDLSEVWTNGRWRSAPHRVVPVAHPDNASLSVERYSLGFFTGPAHTVTITPILQQGEEPRYDGVVSGDYLYAKLNPTTLDACEQKA